MRYVVLSLLLCLPALSGCLMVEENPVVLPVEGPSARIGEAEARPGFPVLWSGSPLRPANSTGCAEASCERIAVELAIPAGHWERETGALKVLVAWDEYNVHSTSARFALEILNEAGGVVASGEGASRGAIAVLPAPKPGVYTIEVHALSGSGPYEGALHLVSKPQDTAPREMLPDLVMMPIRDLAIEHFTDVPLPHPADVMVGGKGCDPNEFVEQEARRCLRFTTAVGNSGEGPLEVRLDTTGAATAIATVGGEFRQRIHLTDGSHRDEPVGHASFHHGHAHYHYDGLAVFTLHAYDLDTETRGEMVSSQRKAGFCFYDMGFVDLRDPDATSPRFHTDANCLLPTPDEEWVTGVSPGWFDQYWSSLSDQYVDVSGVSDGVYELVVAAGDGILQEADNRNNQQSVVFRMTGDRIQVLEAPQEDA